MKRIAFFQLLLCLALLANAQTEVSVSQDYVLDAETGQLIQVVQQPVEKTVVVQEVPHQVVVVDGRTSFEKGVDAVIKVAAAATVVGATVHAIRHHHYPHYCPPCPPRPVYHHHHHHPRPPHRHHHHRR